MSTQLTLSFDPALHERFASLREFVAFRAQACVAKPMKVQAADMDQSPSTLSRKLNPSDGDTQRFNLDDLEDWLISTGDAAAVVEYLASKFMDNDERREQRRRDRIDKLLAALAEELPNIKGRLA
jgi:hypothetical protein